MLPSSLWLSDIPLRGQTLFVHLLFSWTLELFLAVTNSTAVLVRVQGFVLTPVFIYLVCPTYEWDCWVIGHSVFNFLGTTYPMFTFN